MHDDALAIPHGVDDEPLLDEVIVDGSDDGVHLETDRLPLEDA
jgi:hypothetical protein